MKKLFVTLFWIFVACASTLMAQDLKSTINNDPNVKIGKLENGITYYIRENKMPANRVELRLAVNAGSNQEKEEQRGLAHFTEHMAFNGIKGFPGNDVVSKLQAIGVEFGGGLNAYTGFDETVYMIQLPTENAENVEMGFDILHGWANGLLYNSKEIDKERGVIAEEYRMDLGADRRMNDIWWPQFFKNMQYANRLPIGLIDVINNFEYQTIKDFYRDWYRPDLQAVIVVGDINAKEMEEMIIKKFSKIKPVKNPREKVLPALYVEPGDQIVVLTDKEAMGSSIEMMSKFQHQEMKLVEDYRREMVIDLFNSMIGARWSEMKQKSQMPFVKASEGYGKYIGNVDIFDIDFTCKENQMADVLKMIVRENNRVLKYGFVETELKRAKDEMMSAVERRANEIDKTASASFAAEYVDHFLHNAPIPGAKRVLKYAQKYLEGITLEEVNALAEQWLKPNNRFIKIQGPEKEGVHVLTEQEVRDILDDKSLENVEPYVDTYKELDVIDLQKLVPGSIVATKEYPALDAKELTLSNGIKVVLKKTNFKNDQILFQAKSRGGMSQYGVSDIASATFAANIIDRSGIGELDNATLTKKMKGKQVGLAPSIEVLSEQLQGSTTPKDMEFFFQYLNAFFTNVRKDSTIRDIVVSETKERVATVISNPIYKFIGHFYTITTQNDPYQKVPFTYDSLFFNAVNYDRVWEIYHQRFANPADFVFTFVGNFDEAVMNKMLEKYVASMSTSDSREDFNEVTKSFPQETINDDLYFATENQSWVGIAFEEPYEYSLRNNVMLNIIGAALDVEVVETIREEMSGVYSPSLELSHEKYPTPVYAIAVLFSCAPENTDTLAGAVNQLIQKFKTNGPKAETLQKVKEQLVKAQQNDLQQNSTWLSYFTAKYFQDETDQLESGALYKVPEIINGITNEDIVNFMRSCFAPDHFVRVTLYPENMKPKVQVKPRR